MNPENCSVVSESNLGFIEYGPVPSLISSSVSGNANPTAVLGSVTVTPMPAYVVALKVNPNAVGGVPAGATGESRSFFKF